MRERESKARDGETADAIRSRRHEDKRQTETGRQSRDRGTQALDQGTATCHQPPGESRRSMTHAKESEVTSHPGTSRKRPKTLTHRTNYCPGLP